MTDALTKDEHTAIVHPAYSNKPARGAYDGKRYLDSLRDGREVWSAGERIKDVTTHPKFERMAHTLADIYDMQHDPQFRDVMTYEEDNGLRVSTSWKLPKTPQDLQARHDNTLLWSETVHGMCGRLPDFCAAMAIGYVDIQHELESLNPDLGKNATAYYEYARDHDLCLSHGLHDPAMDKSKRPKEDPDRCVRVVKERDDGIIVRGARFNTLGPFSNEILISPTYLFQEDEQEFALWFTVPCDAPGLKQLCREVLSGRDPMDHPVSARFDEVDSLIVFDDVFIPWERIFLYREPAAANRLFRSGVMNWAGDASSCLTSVRLETLVTVAHLLAVTSGVHTRPPVVQALGEMCTYLSLLRKSLRAGHVDYEKTKGGHLAPGSFHDRRALMALYSERYQSLVEHIGTSSMIFNSTAADWDNPEIAKYLETYMRGRSMSGLDRHKLTKLAWELTGDTFGGRQQLYERLHSGDPNMVVTLPYRRFDFGPGIERIAKLLDLEEPVATP